MNIDRINCGISCREIGGSGGSKADGGFSDMLARAVEENNSDIGTNEISLEEMLRARYPGIAYHVFDADTSYWRSRNDYPHYLLYRDDEAAAQRVANWKPEGKNPVYSPFEAPPEIWALGSLPANSKAVIIHPTVQKKMNADSGYAKKIFDRIEAWFEFDVARNEAIMPGCSYGMCQAVAIGEDGTIVNAQSSNPLRNEITTSGDTRDEALKLLRKKLARQAYFIQLHADAVMKRRIEAMERREALILNTSTKRRLLAMMNDNSFRAAIGSSVAGVSLDRLFGITNSQIFGTA